MTPFIWLQIVLYLLVLLALVKPLGAFMARVYQGERTFLSPGFRARRAFHIPHYRCKTSGRDELENLRLCNAAVQSGRLNHSIRITTITVSTSVKSAKPGSCLSGPVI